MILISFADRDQELEMETSEPTESGPQLNNCCLQASESSHEPSQGGWGVQLPPITSS